MLTAFRVENFKVFEDTHQIELAPITLLSGVNSAGKSALIQMLLLLKQTLESSPSQALNPARGPFLAHSLGDNFNDFIKGRPKLSEASLAYHLGFAYESPKLALVPHDAQEADLNEALKQFMADLGLPLPTKLISQVVVRFAWDSNGRVGVRVTSLQLTLSRRGWTTKPVVQGSEGSQPLVGLNFRRGTNGKYKVEHIATATHSRLANLNFAQLQDVALTHFLPDSLVIYGQKTDQTRDIPPSFAHLFHTLFVAIRHDLSERIYYLNSFRTPPSRLYSGGQTAGMVLNPNGSNFAEVLWRFRSERVSFAHPNGEPFELPLQEMVARVLNDTLGLKQRVFVKPVGEREDILEVKVETDGAAPIEVTLADVGLGYNQVLPIIVQGLLTPPGGLVIFEQPEIHLHPEIQARLIDFFAGLARTGRRVLVETHSSHQIDQLCLAIVKDRSNWLVENAKILFIRRNPLDKDHASAIIEAVQINRYGEITNWPPDFLPDTTALHETLLRESLAKRREESTRRGTKQRKAIK